MCRTKIFSLLFFYSHEIIKWSNYKHREFGCFEKLFLVSFLLFFSETMSNTSVVGKHIHGSILFSCLVIRYFMLCCCLQEDAFHGNNAQKLIFCFPVAARTFFYHLETLIAANLLMFVAWISRPVWWQSISKWWWFITSDGWTNPPRWLCSGSWCAMGPPWCISAITI